jgi:hypothetical protein
MPLFHLHTSDGKLFAEDQEGSAFTTSKLHAGQLSSACGI